MMKNFFLVMLLAACSVCCNVTSIGKKTCQENLSSTCQKEVCHSYLDVAVDMISKAKCNIPSCSNDTRIQIKKVTDCADVLQMGHNKSGVYEIWPMDRIMEEKSVYVYCDMSTNGGGWTVIQRRGDFKTPKDYFYRNWEDYKEGFGNIQQDFWLGNDNIFALTNQKPYSVRFDLMAVNKERRYAVYDKFWIDDEERKYTLHISLYTGDAGDSMTYHHNQKFSTIDQKNDKNNVEDCAQRYKGGWWYNACHHANLNGLYHRGKHDSFADGVNWSTFKGFNESLEWTEIKVRPKSFRPY